MIYIYICLYIYINKCIVNIVAGGVTAKGWGGVGGAVAAGLGNQVCRI